MSTQTQTFIPEFRLEKLTASIEKLNKRAVRLGLPEITLTLTGARETRDFTITDIFRTEDGAQERSRTEKIFAVEVIVEGVSPVLAGWSFVATIDKIEGSTKNVLNTSPVFKGEIPQRFRDCTSDCDHCHKERARNNTFVLRNESTGDWKQVGRNCIKDFLGHKDVHILTDAAAWLHSFTEVLDECSDFCGSGVGRGATLFGIREALAVAHVRIATCGWVSAAAAADSEFNQCPKSSTAEIVREELRQRVSCTDEDIEKLRAAIEASRGGSDALIASLEANLEHLIKLSEERKVSPEAEAEITQVIEWAQSLGTSNANDYLANLAAVFSSEFVSSKHVGIAVSAIPAYRRAQEKVAAEAKDAASPRLNEFFGTLGERVTHTLTPVTFRNIETDYGTSTLVIFEDAQRRTFKWFASNCPLAESQQGTPVELTFTIKSHDDWQGRKQTAITRAKIFVPKEKKTKVKK